jgi:hypothetical protein
MKAKRAPRCRRSLIILRSPLNRNKKRKANPTQQNDRDVDSKTFRYLPTNVLDDLNLQELGYDPPLLLFREEYATAFTMLTSWKKPPATGVVVTGYPGIGT